MTRTGTRSDMHAPQDQPRPALPAVSAALGDAAVSSDGRLLRARAGDLERVWRWTGRGLATVLIQHTGGDTPWRSGDEGHEADACDWQWPDGREPGDDALLEGLTAEVVRDDPLTADHLRVRATVRYPSVGLAVRWELWVYPGVCGMRTQLAARREGEATEARGVVEALTAARAERLPLPRLRTPKRRAGRPSHLFTHLLNSITRQAAGYYVGTQSRNRPDTPLRRTESRSGVLDETGGERYPWANLLTIHDDAAGLTLAKESHKGVNQPGYDGGDFIVGQNSLDVTGWGLRPEDVTDQWRHGWAHWLIAHGPDETDRQRAIKQFDRARYPLDPAEDLPVMANLWGSSDSRDTARDLADEHVVIEAIDRAAQLGIEVVQIDDGWQTPPGATDFDPGDWRPNRRRYPNGWRTVRDHAAKRGVGLGLWAAWTISADRLIENQREGGFRHFKIDFMDLDTYDKLHGLMRNAAALARSAQPRPRINWDMTEREPRVGTYFGREFGSVYLANRKPRWPGHCVYVPWLMLRDAWHLAHYTNLLKFQISTTNLDRCDPARSNAARHRHDYALAITLMGSPLWFCHPRELSDHAAAQFTPLLETYKQHRAKLARGIVYPVGDEPSDASWTGFQAHDDAADAGYLMIFRELHAPDAQQAIRLHHLAGCELDLHHLLTDETSIARLSDSGKLTLNIPDPADYRFLAYRVRNHRTAVDAVKR